MRLFGYARVSISKQSLDAQIEKLKQNGVENHRILCDVATGSNTDRSGIDTLLLKVEPGDVVLVCKVDRLGRNTKDMLNLIEKFDSLGVGVRFLDDGISTDGPMGRMVITILSAVAQAERDRMIERMKEGYAEAKRQGKSLGRKKSIDYDKVWDLHKNAGMGPSAISRHMRIGLSTVFKILKEYREKEIKENGTT